MKNIVFAVFSLFLMMPAVMADCKLLSCGDFSWYEPNGSITADPAGNQCWGCGWGPNSCNRHDVVPYVDSLGEVISLYQCTFGVKKSFENYEPGVFCDNSQLKSENVSSIDLTNAKKTYRLKGRATSSTSLGDWDVFSGSAACVYVKCNEGFIPSADKTECVRDTREATCRNSGGVWVSDACTCDSAKRLKLNVAKTACECVSSNYEYVTSSGRCEETPASKQRKQQQNDKQKCEASFGTWSGGICKCDVAKNLVKDTAVTCKCIDANYERNDVTKSCELTDAAVRENACKTEGATKSGAIWNGTECVCDESFKDWNGTLCVVSEQYKKCQAISDATWNSVTEECVCNDANKVVNGTQCVESAQSVATKKIGGALENLRANVADLEVSKWKTEDGKFNTARLASDSIAGVVLGTAGGLITSSVVKKHQVEEGFEDLNCTIGGQTVAGWGDEFTVGIH